MIFPDFMKTRALDHVRKHKTAASVTGLSAAAVVFLFQYFATIKYVDQERQDRKESIAALWRKVNDIESHMIRHGSFDTRTNRHDSIGQ